MVCPSVLRHLRTTHVCIAYKRLAQPRIEKGHSGSLGRYTNVKAEITLCGVKLLNNITINKRLKNAQYRICFVTTLISKIVDSQTAEFKEETWTPTWNKERVRKLLTTLAFQY